MTWLEIMEVLDKMPRHLLKREAELWHYDDEGNYEALPIDDIVTPINDGGSDEDWGPDGDYRLSLQSFDEEEKVSKERVEAYEQAMNVVCGECGNTDGAQCDECWVKRSWRVMNGMPDSPTPRRNPNVAETVGYECKNDPTFDCRNVLLHQATVRWNSGKSFECHAPERVELRIGGTSYEYKAV